MISFDLIWATILVFLISGYVFTSSKIFVVCLLVWFVRLIFLKNWKKLLQALVIGACFFILFSMRAKDIRNCNTSIDNQNIELKVHADNVKILENGISIQGYDNSFNHHGIQTFIGINNKKDLKFFENNCKDLVLKVSGNIAPIDPPTNFNQFDFRRIMFGKKIYFDVKKAKLNKVQVQVHPGIISRLHEWRKHLLLRCQKLPDPLQSYCMGIILGEQSQYLKDNSQKLRDMGIIHLFCISGLHVFYFISLLQMLSRLLKLKKETMEYLQLIVLPIYFFIGGGSTSLLRAIMLSLVSLISSKFKIKKITAMDIWCVVLLVNFVVNPFVLLQMGGQLSYLLSFVLITQANQSSIKMSLNLFFVELPIILYSTYKIHILTVLFNFAIVPVFSSIIVPLVIVSFALPLVSHLFNPVIVLFEFVLKMLDKLPGILVVGKPPLWLVLLSLIVALRMIGMNQKLFKNRLFRGYTLGWSLFFCFLKINPFGEISFFDVGQGDSILIRQPFNKSITMIDTGGKAQFGDKKVKLNHTVAKNSSINYLQSIGVKNISNLCLTHQDIDHIGEASEILKNFKVKNLVTPVGVEQTDNYQENIKPNLHHTHVYNVLAGDKIPQLPLQIKYPFKPGKGENGDSLVLNGMIGNKNILLTGDLDVEGEKNLIKAGVLDEHVDIFKLGHHGSKTSNSEELLKKINPNLAVISAGRNNRYGHPNVEIVQRLKNLNIPSVSTQDKGMISYRFLFNDMGRWKIGIKPNERSIVQ